MRRAGRGGEGELSDSRVLNPIGRTSGAPSKRLGRKMTLGENQALWVVCGEQ